MRKSKIELSIGPLLSKHDFENFYQSRGIRSIKADDGKDPYTCTLTVKLHPLYLFIDPLVIFKMIRVLRAKKPFIMQVTMILQGPLLTNTLLIQN